MPKQPSQSTSKQQNANKKNKNKSRKKRKTGGGPANEDPGKKFLDPVVDTPSDLEEAEEFADSANYKNLDKFNWKSVSFDDIPNEMDMPGILGLEVIEGDEARELEEMFIKGTKKSSKKTKEAKNSSKKKQQKKKQIESDTDEATSEEESEAEEATETSSKTALEEALADLEKNDALKAEKRRLLNRHKRQKKKLRQQRQREELKQQQEAKKEESESESSETEETEASAVNAESSGDESEQQTEVNSKKRTRADAALPEDSEDSESEAEPETEEVAASSEATESNIAVDETLLNIKDESRLLEKGKRWLGHGIHLKVIDNLVNGLGFVSPTPIQQNAIPAAINSRSDLIAAAETGSGKTLAFGIPIVSLLLDNWNRDKAMDTEEESTQQDMDVETVEDNEVNEADASESDTEGDEEEAVEGQNGEVEEDGDEDDDENEDDDDDEEEEQKSSKPKNVISFTELIGDNKLKAKKAKRQGFLKALILTPTRELALQIEEHIKAIVAETPLKLATIVGGISIAKQARLLSMRPDVVVATTGRCWELMKSGSEHLSDMRQLQFLVLDEADRMVTEGHFMELHHILNFISKARATAQVHRRVQNFLFSATLTLPTRWRENGKYLASKEQDTIDTIMRLMDFQKKPRVIDLTTKTAMATTLEDCQIQCMEDTKDCYLYYFLATYKGRTIIFCNSISCVRRLQGLFSTLNLNIFPLHGNMQQKQRLKNLERFRANNSAVLVATDVAARGLDIPDVQYVVHYQLPRSPEVYIHRCGRSGRAAKQGFSVSLVSPQDEANYAAICTATDKTTGMPLFPVDEDMMPQIRKIIKLAIQLDAVSHSTRKVQAKRSWFEKNAEAIGVELDDTLFPDVDRVDERKQREAKALRQQLTQLLSKPIVSRRLLSTRYPTITPENRSRIESALRPLTDDSGETKNALEDFRRNKRHVKGKRALRTTSK